MDFTIVWTNLALDDFGDVVRHLAQRNTASAETLRLRILDSVAVLARLPHIGPLYDRDHSGRTREILCGSYRIFYRVLDALFQVQILRVWHGSRREPSLPPA